MYKDLNEKKLNHSTVSVAGLQGLFLDLQILLIFGGR